MAVCNLRDLKPRLPRGGRLIGLDLGEKTIGMAVSDPGLSLASPIGTIRRTKFTPDAQELLRIVDDRGIAGLVIGLPVNMDGSEGPRCQSVRAFAKDLLKLRELPIAFWDERLSTMAVQRQMIEFDVTRKKRAKAVDTAAAAWILQGALDALQFGAPPTL